jgi:putative hemolysin
LDITFWLEVLLFVGLLGFSAFCSRSETSLFSLTERQLAQLRHDDHPRVGLIERMLNEPRRLIITILIGNELVNVSASVISAALVIALLGAENKWINLLIMVPILLLVGEITPKTLAIRNNVAFASYQSRPIDSLARLITPLRWVVRRIADLFITLVVGSERARGSIVTEDMLRTLAHEAVGEGELDLLEARTIGQIFEFGDKSVEEVMTPRANIHYLPVEMPPSEMLDEIRRTRFSKFPVFEETRDSVVGMLYARDLLGQDLAALARDPAVLRGLLRKAYFVPETKPVAELFQAFRRRKLSLALTVDEFGGVTGLVTMEDLLECIFGEIYSPSDGRREFPFEKVEGRCYRVSGAMPLAAFAAKTGIPFDESVAETVGGLLLHECGELPTEGATLELEELAITIESVQDNRIHTLLVERLGGEVPSAGTGSEE